MALKDNCKLAENIAIGLESTITQNEMAIDRIGFADLSSIIANIINKEK